MKLRVSTRPAPLEVATSSGCRGLPQAGRGVGAARRGTRADSSQGRGAGPPPGPGRRSGKTPPQQWRWRAAENGRWADSWLGPGSLFKFSLAARTLRPSLSGAQKWNAGPTPCPRDEDAQAEGPAKPLGLTGANRQPSQVKPRPWRSPESISPNSTNPNSTSPNSTVILKLQRHF